jgi:hypothetical protein
MTTTSAAPRPTRRGFVGLVTAAATAAGVARLLTARPASAAPGDPILIDSGGNIGEGVTQVRSTTGSSVLAITNDNKTEGNGIIVFGKGAGWGILGETTGAGRGVYGVCAEGVGVEAYSVTGIALKAISPEGVALRASGPVQFSSAGTGAFKRGQQMVPVAGPATPPGCSILVTLNQNPGPGNALKYVKRTGDAGFTVYLLKPVAGRVSFSYFVIANGADM